jgi:glycosyltransferase involved in cell wall biosynthesis
MTAEQIRPVTTAGDDSRPLRIDLVITELFVGGAERCLTELALALHHGGDRVRVASIASLPQGEQGELVARLRAAGIPVHSAQCDRAWQAIAAFRGLRRWFAGDRPDVVQTMLYHANVLGTLAARSAGVDRCIGGIRVAERNTARLLIERLAVRQMDAVVCVSGSVQRFAQAAFGRSLPPTTVIANAVDLARIDAAEPIRWEAFGWPEDAQVLLYIGRLHPQKGLDMLITAIEPLLARYPQMRCLIVGQGPLQATLQPIAQRWGPTRFLLAGWRRDAAALIKAARLVVLPSRYEGMPNVILEAMAAGKPVAASHVEGVAELLGQAAAEQTCPPGDPQALSALIDRLWRNRDRCNQLGLKNRQRALVRGDLESLAHRYRCHYVANHSPPESSRSPLQG